MADKKTNIPKSAFRFEAGSAVVDENKTFRLVPYAGQQFAHWYWGKLAFESKGVKLRKKVIPAFFNHDSNLLVGEIDAIEKNGSEVALLGGFIDTPSAGTILAAKRIEWDCSLSFDPSNSRIEEVGDGAKTKVNGEEFVGPGFIVRHCELDECSFCHYGAVPGASASFAENEDKVSVTIFQEENQMPDQQNGGPSAADLANKGRDEAVAKLKAMTDLSPAHAALAATEFANGSSVEAFAKKVIEDQNVQIVALAAKLEAAEAKLSSIAKSGPAPADFSADGDEGNGESEGDEEDKGDFRKQAKALAEEKKISLSHAMSQLAKSNPSLYVDYKKNCPEVKK